MRKGFTIIEMLVVILIIGIMVGMTIPYLNSRRFSLYTYEQTVVSTLRLARQMAITKEKHYGIYPDTLSEGLALVVFEDVNDNNIWDISDSMVQILNIPSSLTIRGEDSDGNSITANYPLIFNSRGMADKSVTFTISDGKKDIQIFVGISGFIQ